MLKPANKPLDIQATASDSGLDIDVRGSGALTAAHITALARVASQHKLARLTRHGELVAQTAQPMLKVGRANVPLPAGAFLQATAEGEASWRGWCSAMPARPRPSPICSAASAPSRCGSRRPRASPRPIMMPARSRRSSARRRTPAGFKPVEAVTRDLFRRPYVASELKGFDAVVFDPPRQGAEAQARELAKSAVPVVVAVSCDATTFARDAKILVGGGYRLATVTPVDQFRYSYHVEIVAKFMR